MLGFTSFTPTYAL